MRSSTALLIVAVVLFGTYAYSVQRTRHPKHSEVHSVEGQLMWSAQARQHKGADQFVFYWDPVSGFRDVDFHPVSAEGWKQMSSPDEDSTATLILTPWIQLGDASRAIAELAKQGKFKSVQIYVSAPQ